MAAACRWARITRAACLRPRCLAANVTDREPHLPVGVVAVVEVSADDGVLGRRDVACSDADVADPLGQHGEDGALGNLRDLGDPLS